MPHDQQPHNPDPEDPVEPQAAPYGDPSADPETLPVASHPDPSLDPMLSPDAAKPVPTGKLDPDAVPEAELESPEVADKGNRRIHGRHHEKHGGRPLESISRDRPVLVPAEQAEEPKTE
jgi:hypothetical protein